MYEYQAMLKREKIMRDVYAIDFLHLRVLVDISGSYEWHAYKVIRRNTELKDKNDVDIYEDDICWVNWVTETDEHCSAHLQVEYENGAFCFLGKPISSMVILGMEVKGNVYRDPKLLKD